MKTPILGRFILSISEFYYNNKRTKINCSSFRIKLNDELKNFIIYKERLWKIGVLQKDTMRYHEIMLNDYDFQNIYSAFTKSAKLLYQIFTSSSEITQTKEERINYLKNIGEKIAINQTEIGSILQIKLKQIPNLNYRNNSDFYFPYEEFLRQKFHYQECNDTYMGQNIVNARQFIVQTTIKRSSGKYITVTIYYMITISMIKYNIRYLEDQIKGE